MSNNSTLNIINIEIAELKEKQADGPLGIIEMKKLESLLNMKKTLFSTPAIMDEHEDVDEDIFTDEEILEYLEKRKLDESVKAKADIKSGSVKKKKKANKETAAEILKG